MLMFCSLQLHILLHHVHERDRDRDFSVTQFTPRRQLSSGSSSLCCSFFCIDVVCALSRTGQNEAKTVALQAAVRLRRAEAAAGRGCKTCVAALRCCCRARHRHVVPRGTHPPSLRTSPRCSRGPSPGAYTVVCALQLSCQSVEATETASNV